MIHGDERIWEVDCLRGLAVCLMLVANFIFDLYYFVFLTGVGSGFLPWLSRGVAGLFILIAGLSLTLRFAGSKTKPPAGFFEFLRRGLKIVALGMVVTLVTRVSVGQNFVVFGVLHLIGVGTVLAYPFIRHKWLSLFCAVVVGGAGFFSARTMVSHPWFLWLGLQYPGFTSVDYVPLIPWFGVMLLGIFLGKNLYPEGRSRWRRHPVADSALCRVLAICGGHSLIIYFVHQPVFLGVIYLVRN